MLELQLKLTIEQANNLLSAVKQDDVKTPYDSHSSKIRKMVQAKVRVAIEEASYRKLSQQVNENIEPKY